MAIQNQVLDIKDLIFPYFKLKVLMFMLGFLYYISNFEPL